MGLLSNSIVGVIIGGILASVSGMIIVYFTKWLEEKRIKKYTPAVLLSEIKANQKKLIIWVKN